MYICAGIYSHILMCILYIYTYIHTHMYFDRVMFLGQGTDPNVGRPRSGYVTWW
jgi:hypothetical protein